MVILSTQIFLALIPLVAWLLQYSLSAKRKQLNIFRKHHPSYYLDLTLIPFNFFWIYTLNFDLFYFTMLFLISAVAYYFTSRYWIRMHRIERRESHMFSIKNEKLTPAGVVHTLFALIEIPMILSFILSLAENKFVYINSILLVIFLLGGLRSSIKVHGKIHQADISFFTIALLVILIKLFFFI